MILFFHFIGILARYIVNNFPKSISQVVFGTQDDISRQFVSFFAGRENYAHKAHYKDGNLSFSPPVYIQRYDAVALILRDEQWRGRIRKVVDFGCAEMNFFKFMKYLPDIEKILEVDIQEELLSRVLFKARPLNGDYLTRTRTKQLDVYILAGSLSDYDDNLSGADAVILIEVIEHLTPEVFNKMPYTIFHQIKPSLAIFTTPNADFNVLFPNLVGFRHDDHKFEWTRKEFYSWAQDIISQYPEYTVKFFGIGIGPEGTEKLGCCSQMAVFQRCDESLSSDNKKILGANKYKLLKEFNYPGSVDTRSTSEKVYDETMGYAFRMHQIVDYYNSEEMVSEIPLSDILVCTREWCSSVYELRDYLTEHGVVVKERNGELVLIYNVDVVSTSDDQSDEDWVPNATQEPEKESDWDDDIEPLHSTPWNCSEDWTDEPKKTDSAVINANNTYEFSQQKETSIQSSDEDYGKQPLNKIPRKRYFAEICQKTESKCESLVTSKPAARPHSSYVRKSPRKISKSFSLDSCLENINCEPAEVQAFYLNLIQGSILPSSGSQSATSRLSSGKFFANDSDSPLFDSNSCEKAIDSGYPYSFSPHDADLTPEQVEELVTENEIMAMASEDSLSQDDDEDLEPQPGIVLHEVHVEEVVVENGDVANNNRDGEGNNVEGLAGERLVNQLPVMAEPDPNDNVVMVFPQEDPFPPWLLNLVGLAQQPVLPVLDDEGLGDDSSSDCNLSLDPDEQESDNLGPEPSGASLVM